MSSNQIPINRPTSIANLDNQVKSYLITVKLGLVENHITAL